MVKARRKIAIDRSTGEPASGILMRTKLWERFSPTFRLSKKKVALVIGNGDYPAPHKLATPEKDAGAVAKELQELGFRVTLGTNLSRAGTEEAVQKFLAREVPNADVALLYYSGHGVQLDGENYFVPVQAKVDKDDLIPVDANVQKIAKAANLTIVMLDACRSRPGGSQGAGMTKGFSIGKLKGAAPGLAWMQAEQDVYIAYAAAPGHVAYAGTGALSPFTAAFLQFLHTRGLELDDLLRRVRDAVKDATGRKQIPWSNSAVGKKEFFFKPRSYWPMAALAALGLASGIVSALATYSLNSNAADYLAGLLLGITLGAALYAWGAPPAKCLLGAALAGLAWIVVLWGFEHTLHDRSLFRSKGASSTASWFADWPGPKPAAWKMPTTKPLSADDMRIALESDIKDGPKGYDNFQAVSPALKQHYSELQTLSSAYIDLFRSIKRMLFGILGSVVVFCAFAAPFPWLRRARTIGLAAAAGAAAALVLGTTTLSGSKTSLSGWAYQIPWQASLGAVVGYAVVHYVPDMPWVGRTLFPKPSSWKPIAWMMLGGALAGIVSAIVLFNMFPDTADAATAMRLREWDTATSMRGLALAVPGALVLIAGFLIFGRASWVAGLVLTVSLLVAWVAAYGIELGGKKFGLDMSKVVVVTFISLAGAAVVEPRLRQPGVWIVALLATIATGAFHYLLLETHVFETLFFGPEPDKNVFDALLYVTLNMCVGAAIGYGLGLGRDPNPPRS